MYFKFQRILKFVHNLWIYWELKYLLVLNILSHIFVIRGIWYGQDKNIVAYKLNWIYRMFTTPTIHRFCTKSFHALWTTFLHYFPIYVPHIFILFYKQTKKLLLRTTHVTLIIHSWELIMYSQKLLSSSTY